MITQLIRPEEVISLAFSLDDPISPNLVRHGRIEIAQLRYIRPAFGNGMYQKMRAGDYDQFVTDYIRPALAHYVRYGVIGELAVRVGEYGVVRPSSEQSVQMSSATKNDQQSRTDELDENVNRLEAKVKDVQDETTSTSLSSSKVTRNTDNVSISATIDQHIVGTVGTGRVSADKSFAEQKYAPNEASIAEVVSEELSTEVSNATEETIENVEKNYEDSSNVRYSETSDDTKNNGDVNVISATDTSETISLITKNGSGTSTIKSENSGVGNTDKTRFDAATNEEWRGLAHQAFRDARDLLRHAVEYVEANVDQFPEYAPLSGLGEGMAHRRCIGGIVL